MARWEPNAPERLVAAALGLFEERGYEATTVIEIAERAGLTKSTFFRYFTDKREVLFGGETVAGLLAEGILAAPPEATPLEAVAHALVIVGAQGFRAEYRDFSSRRRTVIATNPELLEREALKGLGLTAALSGALEERGVPFLISCVAAELGALTLKVSYERWCVDTASIDFSDIAIRTLGELQAAAAYVVASMVISTGES